MRIGTKWHGDFSAPCSCASVDLNTLPEGEVAEYTLRYQTNP
ncbi:hypothetical protein HMPREF0004_0792 [Achromobacter piechaudii ATCC 43553]|uniref:Uncharacterized protein n=1 Tax=Achromobacter piechaudii ATCC 43553 TaxID=742159 RepID=D4X5P5_9BURK|nr:hypothetical protein HMPREF0004_0792 [Achromobacter piechaudii ATCC 43553]